MVSGRTKPTPEHPNGQQIPRHLEDVFCDSICETNFRNSKRNGDVKNITHEYDEQFSVKEPIKLFGDNSQFDITTGQQL